MKIINGRVPQLILINCNLHFTFTSEVMLEREKHYRVISLIILNG